MSRFKPASIAGILICCLAVAKMNSQQPVHYQPTLESLNRHPLPSWYADAKLGIFIHWGLYSVPGWAPTNHPKHDFHTPDYMGNNPYAEWYYNTMRIDGSPTQRYHREHYGADYNYYNFAPLFDQAIQKWNPGTWAKIFRNAGARYVVLTSKHHEGFTLWPSSVPNPTLPKDRQHATRDLVGELTNAVRNAGMRMGLYYSGGFDWTFVPGPITSGSDSDKVKPQSAAYGEYADAQIRELIERYKPALLWNDIDWPKSGHALDIMAMYYNTVPDGVIDDRFGVPHSDFITPEYRKLSDISPTKWEECRGLGLSFGYNRAEGEAQTISSRDLIFLLVDVVSKNGNLLLDVGPEADGTIPPIQMSRLQALGTWLQQNGDAIYGSRPWTRASGVTADHIPLRFTRKENTVFVTILGEPKAGPVTIQSFSAKPGAIIHLLGSTQSLAWSQSGNNTEVHLPARLPGHYAYVLKVENP
jgi:alpha-L-fucosidase